MKDKTRYLTARKFATIGQISPSAVSRLLREGKIKGEKKSGKWLINESELNSPAVQKLQEQPKPASPPPGDPPRPESYSVAEFSKMTYLTEKGVREWLRNGRLAGETSPNGDLRVYASSLMAENLQRLLRKT